MKAQAGCPSCGKTLTFHGSAGVLDPEDRWDAEVQRWVCSNGHMVMIADAHRILDAERYAAMDDSKYE